MKKFELQNKSMLINVAIPVKVGELTLDTIQQCFISKGKDGKNECEADYVDHENAIYMGMEVKELETLIEFHKRLGIDLNKSIINQFKEVLNSDEFKEFIQNLTF